MKLIRSREAMRRLGFRPNCLSYQRQLLARHGIEVREERKIGGVKIPFVSTADVAMARKRGVIRRGRGRPLPNANGPTPRAQAGRAMRKAAAKAMMAAVDPASQQAQIEASKSRLAARLSLSQGDNAAIVLLAIVDRLIEIASDVERIALHLR